MLQRRLSTRVGFLLALAGMPGPAWSQGGRSESGGERIPPGFVLIDGDILVPEHYAMPEGGTCDLVTGFLPTPWPDGIVPFTFDSAVNSSERQAMHAAMDEWNLSGADVTFVPIVAPDPSVDSFVTIFDSSVNSSSIGMFGPGQNTINVFDWNVEFTMAHELCHTLGFWHEQSRPDRDTYVAIVCGNVSQTACNGPCDSNFRIESGWLTLSTGYDFLSVMHYDQCAFSISPVCPNGGQTILANPPFQVYQSAMGQRSMLSGADVLDMVHLYGPSGAGPRYVDASSTLGAGTLRDPYITVASAESAAPSSSSGVWIAPSTYTEGPQTLGTPRVWRSYPGSTAVVR